MTRGQYRHRVTLQAPGAAVPDDAGGYTQTWADLDPPQVWAAIEPATARDLERLAAGTVIATAPRVITFPFHPQVTTQARVLWTDAAGRSHTASVTGVENPHEACLETVTLCVELEGAA